MSQTLECAINDPRGNIFLLARLFNVEITDNLFNFITASFSEMKGWIKRFSLDLDYTQVFVENLITDMIGSRLSLAIGEDLGFGLFKVGTTLEKIWLNVSQSSLSLDMVLLSSMRLIFTPFDEFWVNNGRTVLQKFMLSVIFKCQVFKIRFLSFFKVFYKDFFGWCSSFC